MCTTRFKYLSTLFFLMVCISGCGANSDDLFATPQFGDDTLVTTDYPERTDATVVSERGDYPKLVQDKMTLKQFDNSEDGYANTIFWMGEDKCYYISNGRLTTVNYETGEYTPVCNRPNCTHKLSVDGCMAHFIAEDGESIEWIRTAYPYRNHLYVLTVGMGYTKIYRSALDGSNRVLLDRLPLEGFCVYSNTYGCLFGQAQTKTGAVLSIDGMRYSEAVYYLVCFSVEDEKFHVISDPLLDYNGNISLDRIEGQYAYYDRSFFSGQLAVGAEEFWKGCVYEFFRYDLSTGETIPCTGTEKQFEPTSLELEDIKDSGVYETGLETRLYTLRDGKYGFITRDGFKNGEEPVFIKE